MQQFFGSLFEKNASVGWPALALLIALTLLFRLARGGGVDAAQGDLPAYLSAAYHLRHDQIFSMAPTAAPVPPGLGREPGYPLFLAGLMALDPGFGRFTPACLAAKGRPFGRGGAALLRATW